MSQLRTICLPPRANVHPRARGRRMHSPPRVVTK